MTPHSSGQASRLSRTPSAGLVSKPGLNGQSRRMGWPQQTIVPPATWVRWTLSHRMTSVPGTEAVAAQASQLNTR